MSHALAAVTSVLLAIASAMHPSIPPSAQGGSEDPPKPVDQPVQAPATQEPAEQKQDRVEPGDPLLTDAANPKTAAPRVEPAPGDASSAVPEQVDARAGRDAALSATTPSAGSAAAAFRFDYSRACDQTAYEGLLTYLAQAFPDLVGVESLGKSRAGRDLWLLRAGIQHDDVVDRRPAVFVCTSLDGASPRAPNAVLYVAESLFWNSRTAVEIERLFKGCTLYFAPALDPDRVFGDAAASGDAGRSVALERNFPAGWEPWSAAGFGHGPYPLSEPESRAVAAFLESHRNVCAVVMLGAERPEAGRGPPRVADAAHTVSMDSDPDVVRLDTAPLPPPGGSLESFCRSVAGARVYVRPVGSAPQVDTPLGPAPLDFSAALTFVSELCKTLPALDCTSIAKEQLRTDLWMVDLKLANTGKLSTRRGDAGVPSTDPGIWMRIQGAALVAAAVRRDGSDAFEPLQGAGRDRELTILGDLDGGASIDLRLIVASTPDARLEVVFEAIRAARERIEVELY